MAALSWIDTTKEEEGMISKVLLKYLLCLIEILIFLNHLMYIYNIFVMLSHIGSDISNFVEHIDHG